METQHVADSYFNVGSLQTIADFYVNVDLRIRNMLQAFNFEEIYNSAIYRRLSCFRSGGGGPAESALLNPKVIFLVSNMSNMI